MKKEELIEKLHLKEHIIWSDTKQQNVNVGWDRSFYKDYYHGYISINTDDSCFISIFKYQQDGSDRQIFKLVCDNIHTLSEFIDIINKYYINLYFL